MKKFLSIFLVSLLTAVFAGVVHAQNGPPVIPDPFATEDPAPDPDPPVEDPPAEDPPAEEPPTLELPAAEEPPVEEPPIEEELPVEELPTEEAPIEAQSNVVEVTLHSAAPTQEITETGPAFLFLIPASVALAAGVQRKRKK